MRVDGLEVEATGDQEDRSLDRVEACEAPCAAPGPGIAAGGGFRLDVDGREPSAMV